MFYSNYFGAGSGPIVYAYLSCDGTESTLADCTSPNPLSYSLTHNYDAGVRCNRVATTSKSEDVNIYEFHWHIFSLIFSSV